MTRRDFYNLGTAALGGLIGLALAMPGLSILLAPLRRKSGPAKTFALCKLDELEVGRPRSFPILDDRLDAWVKYPKEPVGLTWLVRQPEGSQEKVLAFSAECPHLGCSINLAPSGESFRCPCHNAEFKANGMPENSVAPRPMDRLEVSPLTGSNPTIRVQFERFRAQTSEKIPLA